MHLAGIRWCTPRVRPQIQRVSYFRSERTTIESRSGGAVAIPVDTLEAQPDSCEQSYDSFDKMLEDSELPILVDFQAPW